MQKITKKFIFLLLIISIISCNNQSSTNIDGWPDLTPLSSDKIKKIGQQRIFFGHQSVGMNIIDGVVEYEEKTPELNVNIIDFGPNPKIDEIVEFSKRSAESDTGFFAHAGVGKNGDPDSKLKSFENMVDGAFKGNLDYVLFKFCYNDFNTNSNVPNIFSKYSDMVVRLNKKYPNLEIIHVTTPLRNPRSTKKNKIKKFIGYNDFQEYNNNTVRMEYNQLLLQKYGKNGSIFNIANIEATGPDGSIQSCRKNKTEPLCIHPSYTNDGGHLTPLGRRTVAAGFIKTILSTIQ